MQRGTAHRSGYDAGVLFSITIIINSCITYMIPMPAMHRHFTAPSDRPPAYGWQTAYALAFAMVLLVPLGIGFFVYGGLFGPLSDAGGLVVAIILAPVVWTLYVMFVGTPYNRAIQALGAGAVAAMGLGSIGLLGLWAGSMTDPYGAAFLGIQFVGWLLQGFWVLGVGFLCLRTGMFKRRTAWTAIAAGVGAVGGMITLVYSYAVGSFTQVFPGFLVLYFVGFVLWAFWLGSELREMTGPVVN